MYVSMYVCMLVYRYLCIYIYMCVCILLIPQDVYPRPNFTAVWGLPQCLSQHVKMAVKTCALYSRTSARVSGKRFSAHLYGKLNRSNEPKPNHKPSFPCQENVKSLCSVDSSTPLGSFRDVKLHPLPNRTCKQMGYPL